MGNINKFNNPLHDIKVLTEEQLCEKYGIDIYNEKYGTDMVWDSVEGMGFNSLIDWAHYYIEVNEDSIEVSKIGKKQNWDE